MLVRGDGGAPRGIGWRPNPVRARLPSDATRDAHAVRAPSNELPGGSGWHDVGPEVHPLHDHIAGRAEDGPVALQQKPGAGAEFHPLL